MRDYTQSAENSPNISITRKNQISQFKEQSKINSMDQQKRTRLQAEASTDDLRNLRYIPGPDMHMNYNNLNDGALDTPGSEKSLNSSPNLQVLRSSNYHDRGDQISYNRNKQLNQNQNPNSQTNGPHGKSSLLNNYYNNNNQTNSSSMISQTLTTDNMSIDTSQHTQNQTNFYNPSINKINNNAQSREIPNTDYQKIRLIPIRFLANPGGGAVKSSDTGGTCYPNSREFSCPGNGYGFYINLRKVITHVISDSPADKAGLKVGDEIVQIDNVDLHQFDNIEQVWSLIKSSENTAGGSVSKGKIRYATFLILPVSAKLNSNSGGRNPGKNKMGHVPNSRINKLRGLTEDDDDSGLNLQLGNRKNKALVCGGLLLYCFFSFLLIFRDIYNFQSGRLYYRED